MAILSGLPVLNCQSIEATLEFYQQILHFVVVKKRDLNDALYWVHLMNGNTTLMLQAVNKDSSQENPSLTSKITLYFFVDDINELHHFVKAKYNNVSEIKTTDYKMQEFVLSDPEGNVVTIGMSAG